MVTSSGTTGKTAASSLYRKKGVLAAIRPAVRPALLSVALFLFSFIRCWKIPSPFTAALLAALPGKPPAVLLAGLAAGAGLRVLWNIDPDVWQYVGCGFLWVLMQKCRPRTNVEAAALGGLTMLPRIAAAMMTGETLPVMYSCAALPLAMLFAAAIRYGAEAVHQAGASARPLERCCMLIPVLLLMMGLGFFRVGPVNLGQVAAVCAVCIFSWISGPAFGVLGGLTCGFALTLGGHASMIAVSLSLCGLLCAMPVVISKRWLALPAVCAAWAAAALLMLDGSSALDLWAAGIGSVLYMLIPSAVLEKLKPYLRGRQSGGQTMDNAYVSQRIRHMREAIRQLAQALPEYEAQPAEDELKSTLCRQCMKREVCWGRKSASTEQLLSEMMELCSNGKEINEITLPSLAEHGCLHAGLAQSLVKDVLSRQQQRNTAVRRARYKREVTLTHLAALSGTLGELGDMAVGESFDDLRAAHVISQALEQLNIPARLSYARRVEGHLQAALQTRGMPQKALDQLLAYLETEQEMPLSVSMAEKGVIELEEIPLYSASVGMASLCADGTQGDHCGDALSAKRCEGGRLLMMLCDGMGHGEKAHQQSEKTIELLLLLLEVGYTRHQAITAVNGMMLGAQVEERFSTVDLADVDLWTGEVSSEKLGACASWVIRGNHMKKISGSSLPLGIMEEAAPTASQYRLHSGDILVLMSDGVADVFAEESQVRAALMDSLYIQPQRMADAILRNALLAAGGSPKDDMSVMVLLLLSRQQVR